MLLFSTKGCSFFIFSIFLIGKIDAIIVDNKFLPLNSPLFGFKHTICTGGIGIHITSANESFSNEDGEDKIPLFGIYGIYDQKALETSMLQAGIITEPIINPDLYVGNGTANKLLWKQEGKVVFRGIELETIVPFNEYLSFGASAICGKIHSFVALDLEQRSAQNQGNRTELHILNKKMHDLLNLDAPCFSKFFVEDVDLFLRGTFSRDYWNKFYFFEISATMGCMIAPFGHINPSNPAAIGLLESMNHGIYGAVQGDFTLKEDITIGCLFRLNKRFGKTMIRRMPLNEEPTNYGVLLGNSKVSLGPTFIFSPFIQIDGLRDGLGLNIAYTLIHHWSDRWTDLRTNQQLPANTCLLRERSGWGIDSMNATVLYNFGYDKTEITDAPIISLTIHIPFMGLVSKRVPITQGIILKIESHV